MIMVNTNPLCSEHELKHQLIYSDAQVLVVLAKAAAAVVADTAVETVIVTEIGDPHTSIKRPLINTLVKRVKKMVPDVCFENTVTCCKPRSLGKSGRYTPAAPMAEDIALLQYTGGTTIVSKGEMISHCIFMANVLQSKQLLKATV
jgi:long-chain acyl-CoA synthetase